MRYGVRRAVLLACVVGCGTVFGPVGGGAADRAWAQATGTGGAASAVKAFVPPLSDQIPDDAVFYIGWTGSKGAPGYEGSKLQTLLASSQLDKAMAEQVGKGVEAAAGPQGKELAAAAARLANAVWERPGAIYMRMVDGADGRIATETVLIVDAGADAEPLAKALLKAPGAAGAGEAPARSRGGSRRGGSGGAGAATPTDGTKPPEGTRAPLPPPVTTTDRDGTLLMLKRLDTRYGASVPPSTKGGGEKSGDEPAATPGRRRRSGGVVSGGGGGAGGPPPGTLAAKPLFKEAMTRVTGTPSVVAWGELVPFTAQPFFGSAAWGRIDEAGLRNARYAVASAGFEKGEWATRAFVAAPAPRTGVVDALLAERQVSTRLLQRVPANAIYFELFRFDTQRFLKGLADAYGDDGLEAGTSAKAGRSGSGGTFQTANDVELKINHLLLYMNEDVRAGLRLLGPDWVATAVRPTPDAAPEAIVINRPRDTQSVLLSSTTAARWLDSTSVDASWAGRLGGRWRYSTVQRPGLIVHVLALDGKAPPPRAGATTRTAGPATAAATPAATAAATGPAGRLAPAETYAWAVRDDVMVVGTSADAVAAAFSGPGVAAPGGSIVDAGKVKAVATELGAPDTAAVSYLDLKPVWPALHGKMVLAATVLDLAGAAGPLKFAPLVPDEAKVAALLTPAVSAGWTDEAGYHYRSRSPFPGAELAGPAPTVYFDLFSNLPRVLAGELPVPPGLKRQ